MMVSWFSQPSQLSCTHTTETRSRSRSLGVLPLKIPHLNAVQASDEHLPFSPGHRQMILLSGDQANVFQLRFIDVEPHPSPQLHIGNPPAIS